MSMSASKPYTREFYEQMYQLGKTEYERREDERKKAAAKAAQRTKDLSDLRHTADAVLLSMSGIPTGEAGLTDDEIEAIYARSKKKMVDNRELSPRERERLEREVNRAMGLWEDDQC